MPHVARAMPTAHTAVFEAQFVELLLVDSEDAREAVGYRVGADGLTEVFAAPLLRSNPFWGRVVAEREPFEVIAGRAPAA